MTGDTQQEIEHTGGEVPDALVEYNPSKLLALAVQQDLDVDKLERLMGMQERWDAQRAKEAFYEALSDFQRTVPVLEKKQTVDTGSYAYTYAALSDIAEQIRECLSTCGLSYRWEFADKENLLEVTCILTHLSGHSEQTAMTAPADTSGSKNPVQERASTITYLQRYTLIGALGLATANLDDDGRQGATGEPLPEGTDTKAPRPFNRDSLIGFGKHSDVKWRDVEGGYLRWVINNLDGDSKAFAEQELAARESEHPTVKDELIELLKCPGLEQKIVDEMTAMIGQKQTATWYRNNIALIKGLIADAEKP